VSAQRVEALLSLARRIADPRDPLFHALCAVLVRSSGLSPEGVKLALTEHLETSVSPDGLTTLLASVTAAPRCHVVLSANVCVAALRAIVLAVATSDVVLIKPSRRDPWLTELLVREGAPLMRALGVELSLTDSLAVQPGDEVHFYGGAEAASAVRDQLPPGARLRVHGPGFGLAHVDAQSSLEDAARLLAQDVVPFDQQGCLSPRVAFVAGPTERVQRFAECLAGELQLASQRVPRGAVAESLRAEAAVFERTLQAVGEVLRGPEHLVAVDLAPESLLLPPPVRALLVLPATVGPRLLRPVQSEITCVGVCGGVPEWVPVRARVVPLGKMQRPALDGPVDGRTELENVRRQ
jgi:hypothetical protein